MSSASSSATPPTASSIGSDPRRRARRAARGHAGRRAGHRSTVIERRIQRASLIGHVVQDLTYENIAPARFRAELVGRAVTPQYKDEGFFVFSDLRAGDYTLKITGERLQPVTIDVAVPPQTHLFLDSRGDSELVVIARTVEDDGAPPGNKRITFDPVILTRQIRAGSRVVSDGLPVNAGAKLAASLEAGEVSSARLLNAAGLAADSVVRLIRGRSIRMNLDPYHAFGSSITRVVGKVVAQADPSFPLPGARVRVTELNGAAVAQRDVHGVTVFTGVDAGGRSVVLGVEKDVAAVTNERGDYNLYFSNETVASYRITDQTLQELKSAGVPQNVRDVLGGGDLKDKVFRGLERFAGPLREALRRENISDEVLHKHKPLILLHSEGFVSALTLEATLAGFAPATTSAPINTAQRKTVNFELARA